MSGTELAYAATSHFSQMSTPLELPRSVYPQRYLAFYPWCTYLPTPGTYIPTPGVPVYLPYGVPGYELLRYLVTYHWDLSRFKARSLKEHSVALLLRYPSYPLASNPGVPTQGLPAAHKLRAGKAPLPIKAPLPMCLRGRYALRGTDRAYGARRTAVLTPSRYQPMLYLYDDIPHAVLTCGMVLRHSYATCGSNIWCGAMRGTDIRYGATP
eukprot:116752-Rhodomonas_salina.3